MFLLPMIKDYIIYFDHRKFVLTDRLSNYWANNYGFFIRCQSDKEISKVLDFFQSVKTVPNVFAQGDDLAALLAQFESSFKLIHAAGGVVRNSANEYLLIHRRGLWDLPKGKVEPSESYEESAIREVEEETGVTRLRIDRHLTDTFHTYLLNGTPVLKRTHWFLMQSNGKTDLVPQTIEDITEARWVPTPQLKEYMRETYGNIPEVLASAGLA